MKLRHLVVVLMLLGWAPTGATAVLDTPVALDTLAYADGALLIENVGQFPDYILFQAFGSSGRMLVGRDATAATWAKRRAHASAMWQSMRLARCMVLAR